MKQKIEEIRERVNRLLNEGQSKAQAMIISAQLKTEVNDLLSEIGNDQVKASNEVGEAIKAIETLKGDKAQAIANFDKKIADAKKEKIDAEERKREVQKSLHDIKDIQKTLISGATDIRATTDNEYGG